MGSSLQRLEVLIIGLIVLLAGAVVAVMLALRPAAPSPYLSTAPQPIVPGARAGSASVPIAPVTAIPSASNVVPTKLPLPATSRSPHILPPSLALPASMRIGWPWLVLLAATMGGLALGTRMRRRRGMTYTNQSVNQLLTSANATMRDANLKVMRDLAALGLLPAELAAAAGIDRAQPRQFFARLPRLRLPHIHMPRMWFTWPRRAGIGVAPGQLRVPRILLPTLPRPWPLSAVIRAIGEQIRASTQLASSQAVSSHAHVAGTHPIAAARGLTMRSAPPNAEHETRLAAAMGVVLWTSDERVRAVATVIAELWIEAALQSTVMAFDTARASGGGQVSVTIDPHPGDMERLGALPEQIVARRPHWRSAWRRERLEIIVTTDTAPPIAGPLLVPVLTHGRGGKATRSVPLASWRHLGFYGSDARGALHAALGTLLYAQPPSQLALAILDHGEIAPLYRDAAHLVPLPESPDETIERLTAAIKHGTYDDARALLLVIVEPDDVMLTRLHGIAARLQMRPTAPVHLLIAHERVSSVGRELYALLPALVSGAGHGSAALLPGQGDWPRRGEARFIARGMRVHGRAILWDERAIAAAVAELRGRPSDLPPVLCVMRP